jgi:Subtilisin inhibitor-like
MRTAQLKARSGAWLLLVTALCAVLATACGTAAAGNSAASGTKAAPAAKISLHVTVTSRGSKPQRWTLRCDPPGGTHPNPAAACRVLLGKSVKNSLFLPLKRGVMCPMILASTKRATITGSWFGKRLHTILYDGGCDLGRWTKIGAIFN